MNAPTEYLRVSYSSLKTFSTCNRKFEFDKLYPRRERTDDNYAADVGKALHAGYQDYLIHHDEERAIWAMMQVFPYEGEFMQENDYRSFEAALSTLEEMFAEVQIGEYELAQIRRPNTPAELAAGLKDGIVVPAIEVPFEIRFNGLTLPDGRGIAFIGYIDAIMRSYTSGRFRTCDIKTTREKVKDATGKYRFDTQQVPYGIVVDHIAQGEVDSFEVLYLHTYVDLVEPSVQLYQFTKTREDIKEWFTNKLLTFNDIIRFQDSSYFPRTESGCMFYNRPCRYLEPCQSRDKESLEMWFLMGDEPAKQEEFHPWIVAEINV
jgi:ATP-dependent helicase/DNAse subunit B